MNQIQQCMTSEIIWHPNGGRLVVAIPESGMLIRCADATDTFVEVIKRIDIEPVVDMANINVAGHPLVSTTCHPRGNRQRRVGEHYITMGLSPEVMRTKLNQIAEYLEISLYAELFPRSEEP